MLLSEIMNVDRIPTNPWICAMRETKRRGLQWHNIFILSFFLLSKRIFLGKLSSLGIYRWTEVKEKISEMLLTKTESNDSGRCTCAQYQTLIDNFIFFLHSVADSHSIPGILLGVPCHFGADSHDIIKRSLGCFPFYSTQKKRLKALCKKKKNNNKEKIS